MRTAVGAAAGAPTAGTASPTAATIAAAPAATATRIKGDFVGMSPTVPTAGEAVYPASAVGSRAFPRLERAIVTVMADDRPLALSRRRRTTGALPGRTRTATARAFRPTAYRCPPTRSVESTVAATRRTTRRAVGERWRGGRKPSSAGLTGVTRTSTVAVPVRPWESDAASRIRWTPGRSPSTLGSVPPMARFPSYQRSFDALTACWASSNACPARTRFASAGIRLPGAGLVMWTTGGEPTAVKRPETAAVSLNPSPTRTRILARFEPAKYELCSAYEPPGASTVSVFQVAPSFPE